LRRGVLDGDREHDPVDARKRLVAGLADVLGFLLLLTGTWWMVRVREMIRGEGVIRARR
jgi:hypothetical protein